VIARVLGRLKAAQPLRCDRVDGLRGQSAAPSQKSITMLPSLTDNVLSLGGPVLDPFAGPDASPVAAQMRAASGSG
jgi:hypothetical protein